MRSKMVSDETLMDFAAGSLPEPVALAVASHIDINERARASYEILNRIGGALLEDMDGIEIDADALEAVMDRLDEPEPVTVKPPRFDEETTAKVPAPLRAYLGRSLSDLDWKRASSGVEEHRIDTIPGYKAALLRIAPGRTIPTHSHRGMEYTVVLDGAYDDEGVRMERGDLSECDADDKHQPVADPEKGCLCLIVLDAPVKLSGMVGALVNPFLRH